MWRLVLLLTLFGVPLGLGFAYAAYQEIDRDLPEDLSNVLSYQPARASRVYSADGELIGEFFLQKRIVVPLERIPSHVRQAFLSAEDRRFRQHKGFDPIGIARAAFENYVQGGVKQGASTITQQVTRSLLLTRERTLIRKLRELILSVRIERELTKDQILWIYLNQVYLGHGAYGVQAAAEAYFGKDVEHLTIAEAALLAGLPKAPTKLSPYNDYERARERQAYVLGRMTADGVITAAEDKAARDEPLALIAREQQVTYVAAPWFVEYIRLWAQRKYGHTDLLDGGLRIYTTLDMKMQRAAEAAVRSGLEELQANLADPKEEGDGTPEVQAALVAIDPRTGGVRAMVGGYDFSASEFNRATQARRQAGSSIKPFVYATALSHGYTELTVMRDAPVAVRTLTGVWSPKNYTLEYLGNITLRTALAESVNTVAVRLVVDFGLSALVKTLRSVGVKSTIPRHISVALGTGDVTLLEMTAAFATFPAGGRLVEPRFVTQVSTAEGRALGTPAANVSKQALAPEVAYIMTDMMKTVVARGTGRRALALGRPVGGKTGTATDYRDAWFIGYTTDLAAGVWVGRDNFKPIGEQATGGRLALPIWLQFMLAGHPDTPPRDFEAPPGISFVRADEMTGQPASPGTSHARWIPFITGTVPDGFTTGVAPEGFAAEAWGPE